MTFNDAQEAAPMTMARWSQASGVVPITAAIAVAALACVGCGTSAGRSGSSQATKLPQRRPDPAARYSRCIRTHGVPNFPNPVNGQIQLNPGSGIDPNSAAFRAAAKACQRWAPQDGGSGASAGSPHSWPAFAAWLRRQATNGRFSGAVLIAKDGTPILSQADGFANREGRIPNTSATRFDIGSIGKTFTAVAIAQLVEQGKLSFAAPIGDYLHGLPARLRGITVAQLLTHTSGLGDLFARWHPTASPLPIAALLRRVVREPLLFSPGTRFSYSNSGYVLLGAIIEAVTHQGYYDYVRAHILQPAGMMHTGWYTFDQIPDLAHGYIPLHTPGGIELKDTRGAGGYGNPSGGAYATAGDLLSFAQALREHKLLSPTTTTAVLAGKVETGRPGPPTKYGYGFEDEQIDGTRVVGHGGGAPGIEAQLRIYPSLGYTVVVIANLDAAATPVYNRVNQVLAFQ